MWNNALTVFWWVLIDATQCFDSVSMSVVWCEVVLKWWSMPSSSATVPYALNLSSNLHTQIQVLKSFYTEMIAQTYLNLTYLTLFKRTHLHYTTSGISGIILFWYHGGMHIHEMYMHASIPDLYDLGHWRIYIITLLPYYCITLLLYYLITVLPYYCITLFEHWDKCNYVWYVITTLNNYIQWINWTWTDAAWLSLVHEAFSVCCITLQIAHLCC